MKCKGKCFDTQSGDTGAISPEKVAEMDQTLLWRPQLGKDPKSWGILNLSSKRLVTSFWASRLDIRKNFSTGQVRNCPNE